MKHNGLNMKRNGKLHCIWNNLKGRQVELFFDNVMSKWTVRTYTLKISPTSRYYDLIARKDFSNALDAKKYAGKLTKSSGWKKIR